MPGFLNVSIEKALQSGLSFRPLSETIKSILDQDQDSLVNNKNVLNPEKERTLFKSMETIQKSIIPNKYCIIEI